MSHPMRDYRIEGRTGAWEVVMGLEIHAQIISQSKLFSGSAAGFGAEPNSHVSFVDAAMPGMLPVVNGHCLAQAVRTGLGLNAAINRYSVFERKNYFYPDLPQGYQISQFKHPIVGEGQVEITLPDGQTKIIRIERLHVEQDAGKSLHDQHPSKTFVDLNRSGVALMEIVSKPDLSSPEEAAAYVRTLRTLLRHLGTCDGNMEQGNLRCDVNLSVRHPGQPLGTRCEIKNLNSVRHIMQAIEAEARRQIAILEDGGTIRQETRLWDPNAGETRALRSKEDAHDYRYFPDPDLLPVTLSEAFVEEIRQSLPELPQAMRQRFMQDYGLGAYEAALLVEEKANASYFEAAAQGRDKRLAANWVTVELFSVLNRQGIGIEESPVSAKALNGLLALIEDGTISGRIAKEVFAEMVESGGEAGAIVEAKGLRQVSDTSALEAAVTAVLAENAESVAAYRGGKDKLFGFFVGQVMKRTGGKANPGLVNEILKKALSAEG